MSSKVQGIEAKAVQEDIIERPSKCDGIVEYHFPHNILQRRQSLEELGED